MLAFPIRALEAIRERSAYVLVSTPIGLLIRLCMNQKNIIFNLESVDVLKLFDHNLLDWLLPNL